MDKITAKIIFSKFDLPSFVEQNLGVRLNRVAEGKYKCICPFPYHKDTKPSFSIDFKNGGWLWHCYGCGDGGASIQFFQRYYSMSYEDAAKKICEIGGINTDLTSYLEAMGSTQDLDSEKKEIEVDHMRMAIKCRNYLRDYPGDLDAVRWVKSIYTKANKILESKSAEQMKELLYEVERHVGV